MILLSIDPGTKKNAGWAWFETPRCTVAVGADISIPSLVACGVGRWNEIPVGGHTVIVVIEKPKIYPVSRSKSDPNDIVKLAWIGGEIAGRARAAGSTVVDVDSMPHPRDWKATVEKKMMCRRILKHLPPAELEVLNVVKCTEELRKNIIDAIGIGAWWLRKKGLRA